MKNKFLYIGLGALGIVGFFVGRSIYLKRKKIEDILNEYTPNVQATNNNNNNNNVATESFLLKKGSGMGDKTAQSKDVEKLQILLNQLVPSPYKPITVDGKFGSNTLDLLNKVVKDLKISSADLYSVNIVLFNKLKKAVKEKGVSYYGNTNWF